MICERNAVRARRRISQPKFFKPYRGFTGSLDQRKSRCITISYGWRSKRYSNCRSSCSETPFEMSAEFRRRIREMATREKIPQELSASPMHTHAVILRLQIEFEL